MYIILVYDIEVKRVAKVCKYLRQHLNWIQNSVFEGQLTKAQFARVKSGLAAITDPEKDSIIIYQLRDARWMNKEVMGIDKNPRDKPIVSTPSEKIYADYLLSTSPKCLFSADHKHANFSQLQL